MKTRFEYKHFMISPQKFVFGRKVKCITRGLVQPAQNVLENPEKDFLKHEMTMDYMAVISCFRKRTLKILKSIKVAVSISLETNLEGQFNACS